MPHILHFYPQEGEGHASHFTLVAQAGERKGTYYVFTLREGQGRIDASHIAFSPTAQAGKSRSTVSVELDAGFSSVILP